VKKKVRNKGVGGSIENKNIIWTKIKILKQKAFCGKYSRDKVAYIKNAMNFLVA